MWSFGPLCSQPEPLLFGRALGIKTPFTISRCHDQKRLFWLAKAVGSRPLVGKRGSLVLVRIPGLSRICSRLHSSDSAKGPSHALADQHAQGVLIVLPLLSSIQNQI